MIICTLVKGSVDAEFAFVTLEWAFAAVGKLVWLGSYSMFSSTRTHHTYMGIQRCGNFSIFDSSHLYGSLLLWVAYLARELLKEQKYSHSSHFYGRSPVWEGLDSNQYSHSTHLYGRSPLWEGSIKIFFFQKVGHSQEVQFSQ